jgi:GTP cyclohydrolase IA
MKRTVFKAIECRLCQGRFLRITNTHLWNTHQMTMAEYKEQFPEAPIDARGLADSRVSHLKDKTYEEVYGKEQAKQLRKIRQLDAVQQMQNPEQIDVRKEKCGYIPTEDHKKILSEQHTIHGANTYRKRALEHYGLECSRCGKTTENPCDFAVHHKDLNNHPSELGNHALDNLMVLCRSCHAKLHNELNSVAGKFKGISSVEKGVQYILKGLKDDYGLDLTDENFTDTPKRIARAYAEIFEGVKNTGQQIQNILSSAFPCDYDQLILAKHIEVFSMCPHHFLPVQYVIHAAYIPSKEGGKVIGISKLSRLVEVLAKRPVLQEQLVEDVTKYLMQLDGCAGAACIAEGIHFCMAMRGVKQHSSKTITSSLKGIFFTQPSARQELMQLIRG